MLLVTIDHIPGTELEVLGLVRGAMVQTKDVGTDFAMGFGSMLGGELGSYTEMMDEARDVAIERMENEAARLGADAIVGVRLATSAIVKGASEVIAYGTAVKYK